MQIDFMQKTKKLIQTTINNSSIPWALIISSFINKSGELAISLLPMLLIERQVSAAGSSFIMGATKMAQLGGLYIGGFLSDVIGFRFIILASYLLGFVGFTILPFLNSKVLIGIFSVIAQFGSALFNPSARALVREMSGTVIKKNLAWLKTSSNLGQVVSSIFGIILGPLGLVIPFVVDGVTSLLAFVIGFFTLKNPKIDLKKSSDDSNTQQGYFLYSFGLK
jgi:MFS family permease